MADPTSDHLLRGQSCDTASSRPCAPGSGCGYALAGFAVECSLEFICDAFVVESFFLRKICTIEAVVSALMCMSFVVGRAARLLLLVAFDLVAFLIVAAFASCLSLVVMTRAPLRAEIETFSAVASVHRECGKAA